MNARLPNTYALYRMNRHIKIVICLIGVSFPAAGGLYAQTYWDLKTCIDYARENNIQIKQAQITVEQSDENLKQSKASLFPNLNGTIFQGFTGILAGQGSGYNEDFEGQYGLSSSVFIYNGGEKRNTVKQMEYTKKMQEDNLAYTKNNIELSITQAYYQILFARELVGINREILATSLAQIKQSKDMLDAGSIAISDYAQIEAQYNTDKYNLVVSQNVLSGYTLQLKQLLELGINDSLSIAASEIREIDFMVALPDKRNVYTVASEIMPQIKSTMMGIKVAETGVAIARAGYYPSVTLGANSQTSNLYHRRGSVPSQWKNNINSVAGVTLNIPIYNNRQVKTAVNLSKLNLRNAELDYRGGLKTLLQTIETLYENALAGQQNYLAATDKLNAASLSFELVSQQYEVGLTDVVTYLNAKTTYTNAMLQVAQAKYTALMNIKLLNFYKGVDLWL